MIRPGVQGLLSRHVIKENSHAISLIVWVEPTACECDREPPRRGLAIVRLEPGTEKVLGNCSPES